MRTWAIQGRPCLTKRNRRLDAISIDQTETRTYHSTVSTTQEIAVAMFRVACVLMTITGMLACPFVCMANVGGHRPPVEPRAGCSCCQHRWQDSSGESKSGKSPVDPERRGLPPSEACDCICLCKGAVEAAGVREIDLGGQSTLIAWLGFSPSAGADAASGPLTSFAEAPPPPRLGSGRLIRLAFASLLL